MKNLILLVVLIFISKSGFTSDSLTIVAVGEAELQNDKIGFSRLPFPESFTSREKKLLEDISKTEIDRIKFVTSHPWDFTDDMVEVIKNNKNITGIRVIIEVFIDSFIWWGKSSIICFWIRSY